MDSRMSGRRRFNWQLILVLLMGAVVLAGTLYGLRRWRRGYMANKALETGNAAFERGEWVIAAQDLGRYCSLHPKDIDVLLKYAEAQLNIVPQKGPNVRQALGAYRQILREDPTHEEAVHKAGIIYLQTGMPQEAEMILERRLERVADPEAGELLAMSLAAQRKLREAAEILQPLIDDTPDRISAYEGLAALRHEHPDEVPGSPTDLLRTAVARNPASAAALVALGDHLDRKVRTDEARAEALALYGKAADLEEAPPLVRIRLASGFMRAGELAAARGQLQKAEVEESDQLALWLAWTRLAQLAQDGEEARLVAERALAALGKSRFRFLPTAVELYLLAGDEDRAREHIKEIEDMDPSSQNLALLRGLMAGHEGRPGESIRHLTDAMQGEQHSPQVALALGHAYLAQGDTRSAAQTLSDAVDRWPWITKARLALVEALGRSGRWAEAGRHARAVLEYEPDNLEARIRGLSIRARLALADSAVEDIDSVWREVRELEAERPEEPDVVALVAEVASLKGDDDLTLEAARALQTKEDRALQGGLIEINVLWKRDRAAAVARARELVERFPGEASAVAPLADMLLREGKNDDSIAVLERGIENAQGGARRELQLVLGRLFALVGRREDAIELINEVARRNPFDLQSRLMLFGLRGYSDAGWAQEIIDEIKAIEGDGGRLWRYHQAALWLTGGPTEPRAAEAIGFLEDNVKSDPGDLVSAILLGAAYEATGRMHLAVETYRRAYETNHSSLPTAYRLISALHKSGDLDAAGKILDEVAARGGSAESFEGLRLGQQLREGKAELALNTAEAMLERDPDNARMRVFVATLKMRSGDLSGARAILDASDLNEPVVLMASVELLLREGKTDEAVSLCDTLVAKSPDAAAHLFRARMLATLGRHDDALADLKQVVALEPDEHWGWVALGDFYAARNDRQEALAAVERALEISPEEPTVILRACRLYWGGDTVELRNRGDDLLKRAYERNQGDPDIALTLAGKLVARRTPPCLAEARRMLEKLTDDNPHLIPAWVLLARACLSAGSPDAALEAVSRALAAQPSEARKREVLFLKASAEAVRWPALAQTTLEDLWNEDKTAVGVGLALADACLAAQDGARAVSVLEELHSAVGDREHVAVSVALARALEREGDKERALEVLRESFYETPAAPRPFIERVRLLSEDGRCDEAVALVSKRREWYPEDVLSVMAAGEALVALAAKLSASELPEEVARSAEVFDAALLIARETAETHADDPRARLALAAVHQARGEDAIAEKHYREVLAERPDDPVAINNLAWLLSLDRDLLEDALALADRGKALYPEFPDLLDTRAVILGAVGRTEEARQDLEKCIQIAPVGSAAAAAGRFHLAQLFAAAGDGDEAVRLLRECTAPPHNARLSPEDAAKADRLLSDLQQ